MIKASRTELLSVLLMGGLVLFAMVHAATAQQVGREQDITNLRLGQRVRVDDGTCPAGQIKEVAGAKMTTNGVEATKKCVPRVAAKTKR